MIFKLKQIISLNKKAKIRIIIYLVFIIGLNLALFPVLEKLFNQKRSSYTDRKIKPAVVQQQKPVEPKAFITGAVGLAVFNDGKQKIWEPLKKETTINSGMQIATYDETSRLLISVPQNLLLVLDGKSAAMLTLHQGTSFKVNLLWGCLGFKPYASNVGKIFFELIVGTPEPLEINKETVYCMDSAKTITENLEKTNVFIQTGTFSSGEIKFKALYPCGNKIEILATETQKNIDLEFDAPFLAKKRIEVSNNESFQQLVYYSDGFSNKFTSSALTEGKYFWRVMDSKDLNNTSNICEFEIIKQKEIKLILPQNDDVVADVPVTFSWSLNNQAGAKNTYVIIAKKSDMTEIVQKAEAKENSLRYDDPYQTFGTGKFYWQVISGDFKSNIRGFSIYNENDLSLVFPSNGESIKPMDPLVFLKWSSLPLVRAYNIMISSSPSFTNTDLVYSGINSFVISSALPTKEYFVKLSALFNNNRKLAGKTASFDISEIKQITVSTPESNQTYSLNKAKAKKMLLPFEWSVTEGLTKLIINLNSKKVLDSVKFKKNSLNLKVRKGQNTIEIIGYCGDLNKPCAKSKKVDFFVALDDAPMLLTPANKAKVSLNDKGRVLVKWEKTKGEVEYQYATDAEFLKNLGSGKSTSSVVFIKPEKGDCFFRIRKKDSNWGSAYFFTIIPQKPGVPVVVAPYNRKVFKHSKAYFQWNPTRGAEGYELQFSGDKRFKHKKKYETTDTKLSISLKKGKHFWRIYSYDTINGKKRYSNASKLKIVIVK